MQPATSAAVLSPFVRFCLWGSVPRAVLRRVYLRVAVMARCRLGYAADGGWALQKLKFFFD